MCIHGGQLERGVRAVRACMCDASESWLRFFLVSVLRDPEVGTDHSAHFNSPRGPGSVPLGQEWVLNAAPTSIPSVASGVGTERGTQTLYIYIFSKKTVFALFVRMRELLFALFVRKYFGGGAVRSEM